MDELGMLQCSYHGWSFQGDGRCGAIPQAAKEGPEAKARFSPRACAVSYPTRVSQGLLFVWPDEKGWEKASKATPPMYSFLSFTMAFTLEVLRLSSDWNLYQEIPACLSVLACNCRKCGGLTRSPKRRRRSLHALLTDCIDESRLAGFLQSSVTPDTQP